MQIQAKTMSILTSNKIPTSSLLTPSEKLKLSAKKDVKAGTAPTAANPGYFKARSLQSASNDKPIKSNTISKQKVSKAVFSYESCSNDLCCPLSQLILCYSLFKERPACILFDYPPSCGQPSKVNPHCIKLSTQDATQYKPRYKYTAKTPVYNCVVNSLEFAGFQSSDSKHKANLVFSALPKASSLKYMNKFQKTNHFPGSWHLGRKDNMWRNVWKKRREFGEEYNICPTTFIMPEDFRLFQQDREDNPKGLWIYKPVASSCGRGIKMISSSSTVDKRGGYLISKYISDPHTINGLKYDLRIYVLASSFDPLRIYMYQEGLVRFATQAYSKDAKGLKTRFIHLTNYSVNKKAVNYGVKSTYKWPLAALKEAYTEMGIDFTQVFGRIKDVVIKTLISVEPEIICKTMSLSKHRNSCYELYGFDILIDASLKPWLLEVNVAPSLSSGSQLDKQIKTSLMCDIFSLIGIIPYNRKLLKKEESKRNKSASNRTKYKNYAAVMGNKDCGELNEEEVKVIADNQDELRRLGRFDRIFPLKENIEYYEKFFEVKRINNALTWRSMMIDTDMLLGYLTRVD